jgi:uncharacterized protein YihD (DUF1040 family)
MNITYIIGNGFDLNLGLRTSYTNFYDYYNSLTTTKEKIKFLKESIAKDYQTWADLELGLGEYTTKLNNNSEFDEIFEDLTEQLAIYLEREQSSYDFTKIDKTKFFRDLCFPENYLRFEDLNIIKSYRDQWKAHHWSVRIITLNYTLSLENIVGNKNLNFSIGETPFGKKISIRNIDHLHGYIDDRMIVGVNDVSQIKNEALRNEQEILEAFVKPTCNSSSKAGVDKFCKGHIANSDLICIFGSSLGDTDKIWWDLIGSQLKKGIKLLIFTRGNEISKRWLYKKLRHDRDIKKYLLDKTTLTENEKEKVNENIFIALNTDMFSHLRNPD